MAIKLDLIDTFDFSNPDNLAQFVTAEAGLQGDGIAINPVSGTLFVARTDAPNGPPPDKSILEFQAIDGASLNGGSFGTFVDDFAVDGDTTGFTTAVGLTALANGNLLVTDAVSGRILELDRETGAIVDGGIDITPPDEFLDRDQRGLIVGAAYNTQTDTVLVATSRSLEIVEFDLEGNVVSATETAQYGLSLIAGIAIDESTGNLLVTEDFRGSNKIYEIAPARRELVNDSITNNRLPRFGDLVSIIDVAAETGISDPEGITIDPATGIVYVVFDGDDVDDDGNIIGGNQVAAFSLSSDSATQLSLENSVDFADGEGVAFNELRGTLFAVQASGTGADDDPLTWQVFEFNPDDGSQINAFTIDSINQNNFGPQGITALPNGNILLADALIGRVVELDPTTEDFATQDGAIDFTNDTFGLFTNTDADGNPQGVLSGIVYNPDTDTILGTDFFGRRIVELDPTDGTVINSFALDGSTPILLYPQGIAYDELTGNVFVSGDSDSNNTLYEFSLNADTLSADFVGSTNVGLLNDIQDPEGLTIDSATRTLYASFDNEAFISTDIPFPIEEGSQIASFSLNNAPTLGTVDKFGTQGEAIGFTSQDFTTQPSLDAFPDSPAYSDLDGDDLESITTVNLPSNGSLTLDGEVVTSGQEISAGDINNLVYTANSSFSGVDTFLVTASDGELNSAPAHIDLFVSSQDSVDFSVNNIFDYPPGNADTNLALSPDGGTYNPTTETIFAASSFRVNPTTPFSVAWRIIEIDPATGEQIGTILQSIAPPDEFLDDGQSYEVLPDVPQLDINPNEGRDGVQGVGVVQGTGTDRDGNLLLVSTRGGRILEVDEVTGAVVSDTDENAIDFTADFIIQGGGLDRSSVSLVHTVEDGVEFVYTTDFAERKILKLPTDQDTLTENDILVEIELFDVIPEARLQGMAIDPTTGNFLIADDGSGNAAIHEVSSTGDLIASTDLVELGRQAGIDQGLSGDDLEAFAEKFSDPEGLGIDPETRELHVFIDDDGVGVFGIDEIGNRIVTLQLTGGTPVDSTPTLDIDLINSFAFESGDGVVFDPNTGDLFSVQAVNTSADPNVFTFDSQIIRLDTNGNQVGTFPFPNSLSLDASGIDILPNGNLLITSSLGQTTQEFTIDGTQVTNGINIDSLPGFNDNSLIVSTVYDSESETVFGTNFFSPQILEFDLDGEQVDSIDLSAIFPDGSFLQGLTINPYTGNFLVADDSGGSSSIYEINRDGELIASINLLEEFGSQFADPEGITVDAANNTLYAVFDDDDADTNRQGDIIAAFSLPGDLVDNTDDNRPIHPVEDLPGVFNFNQADSNLVVELVSRSTTTVQEIGVFFLDADGTIDGVAPGSNGFITAALARTQVLQSLIANPPTGFSQGGLQRVLDNFGEDTQIAFLRVNDGTISEAIQGGATDIALSTDDDVTVDITELDDGFDLDFNGEFTIKVDSQTSTEITLPPGVGLQNSDRLAALDFRSVTNTTSFSVTVTREAAFDNEVYLYVADDATGTVGNVAPNSDGTYLDAVLDALVPGLDPFEVANGGTSTGNGTLPAGAVILPLIIVDGDLAALQDADATNDPTVFLPFSAANSTGGEHVRILGNNSFGFEDFTDGDYQDLIISFDFG